MCLFTNDVTVHVADEDIHTFKRCIPTFRSWADVVSEVYDYHYFLGQLNEISGKNWPYTEGCEAKIDDQTYHHFLNYGFHSWTENPGLLRPNRVEMYDCIIPRGARYLLGVDHVGRQCYASDKLILVKRSALENF